MIRASFADRRASAYLQIATGDPVLLIEFTFGLEVDREPALFEYLHVAASSVTYRLSMDR